MNCLGSIPDSTSSFEARSIASIAPSATSSFFDLHNMNRLRPSLSPNRTTVLVDTLVPSHLGSCLSHLSWLPLKFINKCYCFRLPLPSPLALVASRSCSSSHLLPNVFYGVPSVKPRSHSFVVTSSVFRNVEKYPHKFWLK